MPFNVKASRLETFHEACQGRALTFEAALASAEAERARAKLASPEPAPACPVCDLQEGHPLCFCESLQPCAT